MKNTVANIKAASMMTGIPFTTIRYCRKLNADGINVNGSVNLDKFKAWYEVNKDKLSIATNEELSIDKLKIIDKQKDIKIKELKILEMESELITPEQVKELLVEIATAQSVMLKKVFLELPPKLAGRSEPDIKKEMDTSLKQIFDILQNKINAIET